MLFFRSKRMQRRSSTDIELERFDPTLEHHHHHQGGGLVSHRHPAVLPTTPYLPFQRDDLTTPSPLPKRSRKGLFLAFFTSATLVFIFQLLLVPKTTTTILPSPSSPSQRQKVPITTSPAPLTDLSQRTIYIAYDSRYGQLNNQLSAFINIATIAQLVAKQTNLHTVVIVPKVSTGFESRFFQTKKKPTDYSLFGDYFDFEAMNMTQALISTEDFLGLDVAKIAKKMCLTTVPTDGKRIEAGHEVYTALNITQSTSAEEKEMLKEAGRENVKVGDLFEMFVRLAVKWMEKNPASQVVPLGKIFLANHHVDGEVHHSEMIDALKAVRPRREYVSSTKVSMATMARPIVAVHVRLLFAEEYFDRDSLVQLVRNGLHNATIAVDEVNTIYLAYGNRELDRLAESKCIEELKSQFPHVEVRICQDGFDCAEQGSKEMAIRQRSGLAVELSEEKYNTTFRASYSAAMLDMWMCVESDFFIGRESSTFSRNIVFVRKYAKGFDSRLYNGKTAFHKNKKKVLR